MKYTEELEKWYESQKHDGIVVDLKFFPGVDPEGSLDKLAHAALETVTGKRTVKPLDTSKL